MRWLFPLYLILVFVGKKLVKSLIIRIKPPDDDDTEQPIIKNLAKAFAKVVVALIIVYVGMAAAFWSVAVDEYWLFFGEKRTAFLEEKYGIILDENVKPKKYLHAFGGPDGPDITFEFDIKTNLADFAEKHLLGEVTAVKENGTKTEVNGEYNFAAVDVIYFKYNTIHYYLLLDKDGDFYHAKIYRG